MTAATGPWAPHDLAERVRPALTALVLIDMQNDTCAPGFEANRRGRDLAAIRAAVPAMARLLAAARTAALTVIHVGFANPADLSGEDGAWLEQRRKADATGLTIAETMGAAFIDELRPAPGELVLYKRRNSAFKGTELARHLRERGIRSLIVTGQGTNVCVESTVREAFDLGYFVTIASEAVATALPELHAASLKTIGLRFGEVVSAADLEAAWGQAP